MKGRSRETYPEFYGETWGMGSFRGVGLMLVSSLASRVATRTQLFHLSLARLPDVG